MLSFSYYLHEKAEESRHNESISFSIAIVGSVFLVGGIVQTLLVVQRPQWFLIFPYEFGASPYDFLGLGFTLMGVMLLLAGIVLGVHYAAQRIWYTNALKDAYRFEEEKLRRKTKEKNKERNEERNEVPELLRPRADDTPEVQVPEIPPPSPPEIVS